MTDGDLYRFGAVLEDIEVDDAIDRIFAIKMGQLHV